MKNKIICIFLLTIITTSLSGCYDKLEVDDAAYIIAIGLDKGEKNDLKMTLQFAAPIAIGGGGGEGGGGDPGKSAIVVTVDCPTIYSGLNTANTFVSKELDVSHTKLVVFSKELAQEGIVSYVRAFARTKDFRPSIFMAVSRGSAEDYIRNVKPLLEIHPAKYYELNYRAYDYTGFSANTQLHRFRMQMFSRDRSPFATLVDTSKLKSSQEFEKAESTAERKDRARPLEGDYLAGDIPKVGDIKSELMGVAVFREDKMVGELDGAETTALLMIRGEFRHAYITIPDPLAKDKYVVLDVVQNRPPVQRVKLEDQNIKIQVEIFLEGDIASVQDGTDYADPEKRVVMEKAYEDFFKEEITRFLNRTARELNSDVCGFGQHAKQYFLTWKEWENYNWLDRYKNATFDVKVDMKVRRPGLLIHSVPVVPIGGGEKR